MEIDLYTSLIIAVVLVVLVLVYKKVTTKLSDLNTQLQEKSLELNRDAAQIQQQTNQISTLQTQLSSSQSQLDAKVKLLSTLQNELASNAARLQSKSQELLNLRIETCKALDSEAASTGYNQQVCQNNMTMRESIKALDMSLDALVNTIIAYNATRWNNPTLDDALKKYYAALKAAFSQTDNIFGEIRNEAMRAVRSLDINGFKHMCMQISNQSAVQQIKSQLIKNLVGSRMIYETCMETNPNGEVYYMSRMLDESQNSIGINCYNNVIDQPGILTALGIEKSTSNGQIIIAALSTFIDRVFEILKAICAGNVSTDQLEKVAINALEKIRLQYSKFKNSAAILSYPAIVDYYQFGV